MPIAHHGQVELYYETLGSADDPTLMMINGGGSQCIAFDEAWCQRFVDRGLRVLRFDNRDVGLSTHLTDAPAGSRGECYLLSDMAADAVAVLDDAGIDAAHVLGLSLGGMMGQVMAIEHPQRVLTLTSALANTGEPGYGDASPEIVKMFNTPHDGAEATIAWYVAGMRLCGSPAFVDDQATAALWRGQIERCFDPAGAARQTYAMYASGSRADALCNVRTPTLVIHGDKDTLVDPSGGRRTAELVPGARFELIEGMGHDFPPQLWDRLVDLITEHISTHSA
jgi:pimeloyl-ACP methyl ester carboxylesterase